MTERSYRSDVVIAGAGLAGLVAALELLDSGRHVLLLDRDSPERIGGLARDAFGGITMVDTPYQRRTGIRDSPELAFQDWCRYGELDASDPWPWAWARLYCEQSVPYIYEFLRGKGVRFLPVVTWPERGWHRAGNSVPRWHVTWGLGNEIVSRVLAALESHPHRQRLELAFHHEVVAIETCNGRAAAFTGKDNHRGTSFRASGEHIVIASGGLCGGDLSQVRKHWDSSLPPPPAMLLNGAHRYGDGRLQDLAEDIGAHVTHRDRHWHYAAGVHHPARQRDNDGLSLVPPRSALWLNARGERIGPAPLVGYTDTRHLVETVLGQPGQYSWQIMNRRIARTELAVSGYDYMQAFRYKRRLRMVRDVLFGNRELVDRLLRECPDDMVAADSLEALAEAMNARSLYGLQVDPERMRQDIAAYDAEIARGKSFFNDEQLRRIDNARHYRGDRVRTCRFQPIIDPKAGPLIAIREHILSRKSLGGIQTDLESRALSASGQPMPGLYAIGEAAGFGGGGLHGKRSLEGTFIGGCVLSARRLTHHIAGA
nr:FAD-binding protein [Algiphilus aromaticivorans]